MIEIIIYETEDGEEPFNEFLDCISDTVRSRIQVRLDRVEMGNLGDYKSVGDGIYELRFVFGPGYRVYFGKDGQKMIILLCGGDKKSQSKDIQTAKKYWKNYKKGR